MRRIKQKTFLGKISSSYFFIIILLIIAIFLGRTAIKTNIKEENNKKKMAETQKELAELKKRSDELANKIEFLSTDEGVESLLRTKYLGVKPGESVAVIVENKDKEIVVDFENSTSSPKESWRRKILHLFPF